MKDLHKNSTDLNQAPEKITDEELLRVSGGGEIGNGNGNEIPSATIRRINVRRNLGMIIDD